MRFQLLVAAVNAQVDTLIKTMNIKSDAIIANQCKTDLIYDIKSGTNNIIVIESSTVGVGKNRNLALDKSDADICLFSDEDIVYEDDYEAKVLNAFKEHEDASVITFNVIVDERRRTYFNEDVHEIKWNNYGRYPAYAIAIKRQDIVNNNIKYSLLFGGGAKYSNGEDSLFLHDCLKAGLKMYAVTDILGKETYRESTWFKGYTEKYFFDRGVLYHFLYEKLAFLMGLRFLIKTKKDYEKDYSIFKAYGLLLKGVKEGKKIC